MIDELLNNTVAAQILFDLLPEKKPNQWALWLQNNRNMARRISYRIPFEKLGGGVFYRRNELTKFVEWEKMRRLGTIKLTGRAAEVLKAFGIGDINGSTTGRKLIVTSINGQIDEGTGQPFVQLVVDNPLMVYRLEINEAKGIAEQLNAAAQEAAHIAALRKGKNENDS